MRKIALGQDDRRRTRLLLNGPAVFQVGPLDQGFWPDGLYTAADRRGAAVRHRGTTRSSASTWRASTSRSSRTAGTTGRQAGPAGLAGHAERQVQRHSRTSAPGTSRHELRRMIDARRNHPSIVMWVPFNEGWGQYDTARSPEWIAKHDPSRLVNNASGWTDRGCGRRARHAPTPGRRCPPSEATGPRCSASSAASACPERAHLAGRGELGLPWASRARPNCRQAYQNLHRPLRLLTPGDSARRSTRRPPTSRPRPTA